MSLEKVVRRHVIYAKGSSDMPSQISRNNMISRLWICIIEIVTEMILEECHQGILKAKNLVRKASLEICVAFLEVDFVATNSQRTPMTILEPAHYRTSYACHPWLCVSLDIHDLNIRLEDKDDASSEVAEGDLVNCWNSLVELRSCTNTKGVAALESAAHSVTKLEEKEFAVLTELLMLQLLKLDGVVVEGEAKVRRWVEVVRERILLKVQWLTNGQVVYVYLIVTGLLHVYCGHIFSKLQSVGKSAGMTGEVDDVDVETGVTFGEEGKDPLRDETSTGKPLETKDSDSDDRVEASSSDKGQDDMDYRTESKWMPIATGSSDGPPSLISGRGLPGDATHIIRVMQVHTLTPDKLREV
ncbi:hypothetical protein Syun_009893 [Stephania yunnanensis]|uniref:BAG domain-containing protein n=1 Tax=Stephania yunnanensis TaxID=152371 RepID=A0AAP0PR38_9MAGN